MGRPREHDDTTRQALLQAAEKLLREGGEPAISVRAVADRVGTTTRAVYSVFGSKDALLFAVAEHGFDLLGAAARQLPDSDDPLADIVRVGTEVFRPWALKHPALYRLMYRLVTGSPRARSVDRAGRHALDSWRTRIERACDAGLLPGRDADEVTLQLIALAEGIATIELRGLLRGADADRLARDAFESLVRGMSPRAGRASSPVGS
jgi:AcrR family transcriptional regulator